MCLATPRVRWSRAWNWDGDRIVHDPIVPSSRPVVGRKSEYDIDPREFLVTERNAVMRDALERKLKRFVGRAPGGDWRLFTSRKPRSFDHRVDMIAAYVSEKIAYVHGGGRDPWQFPDETLSLHQGDCEDRALLLASLLLASGVSSFNVRVALGQFVATDARGETRSVDHAWVVYKTEAGRWVVVEPARATEVRTTRTPSKEELPARAEYRPTYLFNDVHLWAVDGAGDGGEDLKRDWSSVHPTFVGEVHKTILHDALDGVAPAWALDSLNRRFTSYFWSPLVDDVDNLRRRSYDPLDHFDDGFVDESWAVVAGRLGTFASTSPGDLDAFFLAAHGIADFYAHTSYAHFAEVQGAVPIRDPNAQPAAVPAYGAGTDFDLESGGFTTNARLWQGTPVQALQNWNGALVSGRYGQTGDSQSFWEQFANLPSGMEAAAAFAVRGSLPHHDEIAVDDAARGGAHRLYGDAEYARQFAMRTDAAVRHIRKAFTDDWRE